MSEDVISTYADRQHGELDELRHQNQRPLPLGQGVRRASHLQPGVPGSRLDGDIEDTESDDAEQSVPMRCQSCELAGWLGRCGGVLVRPLSPRSCKLVDLDERAAHASAVAVGDVHPSVQGEAAVRVKRALAPREAAQDSHYI